MLAIAGLGAGNGLFETRSSVVNCPVSCTSKEDKGMKADPHVADLSVPPTVEHAGHWLVFVSSVVGEH